jgi:hypothetical protein
MNDQGKKRVRQDNELRRVKYQPEGVKSQRRKRLKIKNKPKGKGVGILGINGVSR